MSISGPVRVCGVQTDPRLGEPAANSELIRDRMSEAVAEGAQLDNPADYVRRMNRYLLEVENTSG